MTLSVRSSSSWCIWACVCPHHGSTVGSRHRGNKSRV